MDRPAGPILGWRAWRIATGRDGLRLRSAVYDDDWPPGVEIAARCKHGGHAAPATACACGIHAARDPAEAARYLVGRDDTDVIHRVVGLVALTGVVVEHARGWRAERGVPARLWVPAADTNGEPAPVGDVATALGSYGVAVDLVPGFAPAEIARAVEESSRIRHSLRGGPSPPRRKSHTRMTRPETP